MNVICAPRSAVAVLFVLALGTPAVSQTCFEGDAPLASGGQLPNEVELGDIDADGDLFIAFAAIVSNASVRSCFEHQPLVPACDSPTGIAVADVDGGLAFPLASSDSVRVFITWRP